MKDQREVEIACRVAMGGDAFTAWSQMMAAQARLRRILVAAKNKPEIWQRLDELGVTPSVMVAADAVLHETKESK